MNVKQFAVEIAFDIAATRTVEEAGELVGKIINATGKDPRAISVTLAYIEDEISFDDACGLWSVFEAAVPGVSRPTGGMIKNSLWFEGIVWDMSTPLPFV